MGWYSKAIDNVCYAVVDSERSWDVENLISSGRTDDNVKLEKSNQKFQRKLVSFILSIKTVQTMQW